MDNGHNKWGALSYLQSHRFQTKPHSLSCFLNNKNCKVKIVKSKTCIFIFLTVGKLPFNYNVEKLKLHYVAGNK
jgi:hypothetical protein